MKVRKEYIYTEAEIRQRYYDAALDGLIDVVCSAAHDHADGFVSNDESFWNKPLREVINEKAVLKVPKTFDEMVDCFPNDWEFIADEVSDEMGKEKFDVDFQITIICGSSDYQSFTFTKEKLLENC
jgi:hypothetical protein